jgi:hypothetical protein
MGTQFREEAPQVVRAIGGRKPRPACKPDDGVWRDGTAGRVKDNDMQVDLLSRVRHAVLEHTDGVCRRAIAPRDSERDQQSV